jgi:K+/H+ antiporter YhaU regulatory subunit KhtT
LVLDAIGFTLVLGLTTWGHAKATHWLVAHAELESSAARYAVIGAVLLVLAPLLLSGVKNTLAFSRLLADLVLPSDGFDPLVVRVSRHSLRITVLLAATLGIGVPTVAALGPVMGNLTGALLLGAIVLGMGMFLYRSAHALDHEFESGAETLAALMARQVSDRPEPELSDRSLLPGLDHARTFLISEQSHACHKTLGEVHLRARTGATVIALRRDDDGVTLPTGHEPLRPGDRLALVGTTAALERAELLLASGPAALDAEDAPQKPGMSELPPE